MDAEKEDHVQAGDSPYISSHQTSGGQREPLQEKLVICPRYKPENPRYNNVIAKQHRYMWYIARTI